MEQRALGGLSVSLVGLGTSRLASLGSGRSRDEVLALLDVAAAAGINFIDTADSYGSGACERLLGAALARRPGQFRVATKGGYRFADLPGPLRPLNQFAKKGLQAAGRRQDFAPATIARRIDGSLRRLGVESIDVYFLHEPPAAAVTDELTDVLHAAVAAGKIRALGVSSDDPGVLGAVLARPGWHAAQTSVRVMSTQTMGNVAVVANQVLASASPATRAAAERQAAARGTGVAGVLLRDAAARPGVVSVLVGTSNPAHLRENAAAFADPVTAADRIGDAT